MFYVRYRGWWTIRALLLGFAPAMARVLLHLRSLQWTRTPAFVLTALRGRSATRTWTNALRHPVTPTVSAWSHARSGLVTQRVNAARLVSTRAEVAVSPSSSMRTRACARLVGEVSTAGWTWMNAQAARVSTAQRVPSLTTHRFGRQFWSTSTVAPALWGGRAAVARRILPTCCRWLSE